MSTPADITLTFAALEGVLSQQYPGITTMVKAKGVGHEGGKAPTCGWTVGNPVPSFVISEWDAEALDEASSFSYISLGYPITIEYCKSASPKSWVDDPEIRSRRIELLNLFFKNGTSLSAIPNLPTNVFGSRAKMLPIYSPDEKEMVVATGIVFILSLTIPRPGFNI